jgi:Icc-related predicted phosphoesterase
MATYAISDIHGRIAELNHLLEYIALGEQDMVVFLGDILIVDRIQKRLSNGCWNWKQTTSIRVSCWASTKRWR